MAVVLFSVAAWWRAAWQEHGDCAGQRTWHDVATAQRLGYLPALKVQPARQPRTRQQVTWTSRRSTSFYAANHLIQGVYNFWKSWNLVSPRQYFFLCPVGLITGLTELPWSQVLAILPTRNRQLWALVGAHRVLDVLQKLYTLLTYSWEIARKSRNFFINLLKSSGKLSSWNCRHPVIDRAGGIVFRSSICLCVCACVHTQAEAFLTGFAVDF